METQEQLLDFKIMALGSITAGIFTAGFVELMIYLLTHL